MAYTLTVEQQDCVSEISLAFLRIIAAISEDYDIWQSIKHDIIEWCRESEIPCSTIYTYDDVIGKAIFEFVFETEHDLIEFKLRFR
jgi:hypothetical protein